MSPTTPLTPPQPPAGDPEGWPAGWKPQPPWQQAEFARPGLSLPQGRVYSGTLGDVALDLYWMTGLAEARGNPRSLDRDLDQLTRLRQANLVPVEQAGRQQGTPFQLLSPGCGPAPRLVDRLTGWPWPHRLATELVVEVLAGLAAAHDLGIGHFDLQPGRIELSESHPPRLGWFALHPPGPAAHSGRGLATVAPERWRDPDRPAELSEDVWAVGALLYELLGGRPPFAGGAAGELRPRVLREEPVSLHQLVSGLPRPLVRIVEQCLEKDPGQRHETAGALRGDLVKLLAGEVVELRGPGLLRRLGRWIRRHPVRTLGPIGALTATTVWGWTGWSRFEELLPRHFETEHNLVQATQSVDRFQTALRESLATLRRTGERIGGEPFQFHPEAQPLRTAVIEEIADFNGQLLSNTGGRQNDDPLATLARLWIADRQREQGELEEAIEGYHQVMRVLQFQRRRITPQGPGDDPQILEALVACNRGEGLALLPMLRYEEALGCFDAAINLSDKVVEAGGGGPQVDLLRALSQIERSQVHLREGRAQAAATDADAGHTALLRLTEPAGDRPDSRLVWARAEALLARGLARTALDQPAEARSDLEAARELIAPAEPATAARASLALDARPLLARIEIALAGVCEHEQQPAEARRLYEQAAGRLAELLAVQPRALRPLADLAACQEGLGETDLARQTRAKLTELLPPPVTRGGPPQPSGRR